MRTPFLRELKRLYARSKQEAQEPSESTISRRDFLKAATVTVAATAAPVAFAKPRKVKERVVIVGGGTAGLTCAYRLLQQGIHADIYEASSRMGGRMFSAYNTFGMNEVIELGGELVDSGHEELITLTKELGLHLTDLKAAEKGLKSEDWFFGGKRYTEKDLLRMFRPIARRIDADLENVDLDVVSYKNPGGAEKLDWISIPDYLEKIEADQVMKDMLSLAYTTEYGLDAAEQSATNLLYLIGTDPGEWQIYGESDEAYHITEGSGAVPKRLSQKVNSQIHVSRVLERVSKTASGRYQLDFKEGPSVYADHVVFTIPFSVMRHLDIKIDLPEAKRQAIQELGYGTNSKLMVGLTQPIWKTKYGYSGSTYTDLPFQTSWETTKGQKVKGAVLTRFTGGTIGLQSGEGTPQEQAYDFIQQMETLYPGVQQAYTGNAVRMHWPTKPHQLGSYSCYKIGQFTSIRGAEGERLGRLYFAGEHTSPFAQGYMEGAVESGNRVAREVLKFIK
ncbi:flavin monoamine oxidase family protein [Deinococcus cellulosilyticus]|uniref:Amine oxidase domain-containing protein n=1 Tax=Deinococcus cellulosilyticus (strain DSM 18568 / NBRC 106333 / KACC 11606 / 5516J-15) TaxID=1223518 RepID=A0A511N6L8_DEIC1|nr:NAD(P)/FAD-dependent oxidoreductase [Deinococcus cellulosilyticus]GEM48493.1 hypothetical protein DC3_41280 [Deinococcus cellulosilyticus NBRC 106333 = KACC 11606]